MEERAIEDVGMRAEIDRFVNETKGGCMEKRSNG